ncbi:MAG: hypothetical protein RDU25_05585 [Patescibacteria group bacterium]|nr:hypothetical protein [Patescibacteria group bacterium]
MWNSIVLRWQSLAKGQQILLVIFSFAGALTFGLSLYRISYSIRAPFLIDTQEIYEAKKIIGLTQAEEIAKQKRLDTDGDGLSDWDEENVYNTNPNSRDSCGDGLPDNVRVISGKNLVCGQAGNLDFSALNYASDTFSVMSPDKSATNDNQDLEFLAQLATSGSTMTDDSTDEASTLPRNPVMIRQILKGQITDEELDSLTDEQLLQYYDAAIAELKQQQADATNAATQTNNQ